MIILASNSPRRKEILGRFTEYKSITEEIDENNSYYESPQQLVMALSFEKGIKVAQKNEHDIVLSADTIVALGNKVLGKPQNRDDAFRMLKELSGKSHEVYTGYSLFKIDEKIKYVNYVKSSVYFRELSDEDIENYLKTGEYMDKAGSYAIQGYGELLISRIEGDFNNIVGLPISDISAKLKSLFNLDLLKGVADEKAGEKLQLHN